MADFWRILGSHASQELRGGNTLAPVRTYQVEVDAFDRDGVPVTLYFEYRIDMSVIDVTAIEPILAITARDLVILAQDDRVVGLSYIQDVNPAGQLIDLEEIIVDSTSGNSTQPLDWPLGQINGFVVGPKLAQVRATLDTIEGI